MLTEQERDQMAHAIGHHSAKGCSVHGGRNHYVADANDPLWSDLVDRGLACRRGSSLLPDGEAVFHVTDDGRVAVESDPRSARKGRAFAVYFRGQIDPVRVYAKTHSSAKWAAIRDVLDCFPDGPRDAFMSIESVRLADGGR